MVGARVSVLRPWYAGHVLGFCVCACMRVHMCVCTCVYVYTHSHASTRKGSLTTSLSQGLCCVFH